VGEEEVRTQVFNTPLECGVRSVFLLVATYPTALDVQRIVDFDYLAIHSADAGGDSSLHAALPLRSAELLVRRSLIQRGLLLMIARGLVERRCGDDGFTYVASEAAAAFVNSLDAPYLRELKDRTEWVAHRFGGKSEAELRAIMRAFFVHWASEFQPLEPDDRVAKA